MSEAQVVTQYLLIKERFKRLNYNFTLYNENSGFTAYGGGGYGKAAKTYRFVTLAQAENKLDELET